MSELSNEELAMRIKNGEKELLPTLWEQVKNLIAWKAQRYFNHCSTLGTLHYELDDLIQESYFAMLQAIEYYEPGECCFNTYLGLCIKTSFASVAGSRTPRQRNNPLNFIFDNKCISLDVPLNEESTDNLVDFIPSENIDFENVEERIYNEELHNALDKALATLTDETSDILKEIYYRDKTEADLAKEKQCSAQNISQRKENALDKLRFERKENGLEAFLSENVDYFAKVGVTQFKSTWVSATEKVVLARERFEERYLRKKSRKEKAKKEIQERLKNRIIERSPKNKVTRELMKKYNIDKMKG